MTAATDSTATASNAQAALTTTLDRWKDGVSSVTEQFRSLPTIGNLPKVDLAEAVERQFAFIQRLVDLNHSYARQLAEVANTLTGVTRSQLESVGNVVRDEVTSGADVARTAADTAEEAARQEARDAAKAERAKRKEAADQARARYEDLSKAELSEEAAKRDLPKTGTVDELVARLVEADTK